MRHVVIRALFAYWTRLRGGRCAPERADIDPAAIRDLLSDTFILEVAPRTAGYDFTVRLSASRLNALFLGEQKGRSLLEMVRGSDRDGLSDIVHAVMDDCRPTVTGLRGGPDRHPPVDFEMILLPLRHHGRTHARVLGALVPMTSPSWLGLLPVQPLAVGQWRTIDGDAEAGEHGLKPPPLPAPKRYGTLVVHQGGR